MRCCRNHNRNNNLLLLLVQLVVWAATFCFSAAAATEQQQQQQPKTKHKQRRRTTTKEEGEGDYLDGELIENRVVGGTAVPNISKYPFYLEWEDAKCGASLIHDDIALSAAHCENDKHPFDTRVFGLGLKTEQGTVARYITQQVSHPLYTGQLQDYDFMLLKLSSSALKDPTTGQPTDATLVTLNRNDSVPQVGDPLIGMGFGKLGENEEDTSPDFMEVEIYYIDNDICMEQYGESDFLPELMFCAGVPGGGRDTCQGDSGGPIMHQGTNTQVGVVSFGIGCAQPDYAGVNARVSSVMEWIDEQICILSDMPPARCNGNNGNNGNGNGNGNNGQQSLPSGGKGQITINIQYDDYPEETAWDFRYLVDMPGNANNGNGNGNNSPMSLFLSPFAQDDSIADRELVSKPFTDLPSGTYSLRFGDQAGDGNCCSYGDGKVWLQDTLNDVTVWENDGNYGSFVEIQFEIYPSGAITLLSENTEYDNSWEAFEAVNHPPTFDGEWPGNLPAANLNTVTINVKYDKFPQEITWTFTSAGPGGTGDWESLSPLRTFYGSEDGVTNQLVSVELDNLSEGWHRFKLVDKQGDGICCQYRRGWVSITGPLITTKTKALIWGNNGEFGGGVNVYLMVDAAGYVSQVSYLNPLRAGSANKKKSSSTTSSSMLRKTIPGERTRRKRRELELTRRHELSLSTWTDLPKQQLKRLPSR